MGHLRQGGAQSDALLSAVTDRRSTTHVFSLRKGGEQEY
jgi:hypothetical protein